MSILKSISLRAVFASALALLGSSAFAVPVTLDVTVDNSYALYYGTATQTTNFVGSDFSWGNTETYNFDLPTSNYLYIVTESDLAVAQGLLAQFTTSTSRFYSQDSQWQVTATGRRGSAPYTGSAASFAELDSQLALANAGNNPSAGWTNTTAGGANGSSPWGARPAIDNAAQWVWYNSNNSNNPTLGGFNHQEYLIFRISIGASEVPEPAILWLFAIGLLGLGATRMRRA